MENNSRRHIQTEPYKGVRDFYPKDMQIKKGVFANIQKTVEGYGYEEYDASILEPSNLYLAKTGEEIVNEQTYSFVDRGGRNVTLRPEMTPSLARMIAGKRKELLFPIRWYSIPNLFRYEKPQRGRLREHYQLNADLFGGDELMADTEILSLASSILKNFGATEEDFTIKINNRKLLNEILTSLEISNEDADKILKILDKKNKLAYETYKQTLLKILGDKMNLMLNILDKPDELSKRFATSESYISIQDTINSLKNIGINNVVLDPYLTRGFDYYTALIFEVYDTDEKNNRSMFGGGRYDNLMDIFGVDRINAVGFGMGDVTLNDFLQEHNLMPKIISSGDIYICLLEKKYFEEANKLASELRNSNIKVEIDISKKKIGDQLKVAVKKNIPYVICIGENEVKEKTYPLKNLKEKSETKLSLEEIIDTLNK